MGVTYVQIVITNIQITLQYIEKGLTTKCTGKPVKIVITNNQTLTETEKALYRLMHKALDIFCSGK